MNQLMNLVTMPKVLPEMVPEGLRDRLYVSPHGRLYFKPPPAQFLRNDGQGVFSDDTAGAGLDYDSWSLAAQACDLNNDGWQDLYVSSDFETLDRLYINNRNGTFTDQAKTLTRKCPWYSMGLDTGDFNNDGEIDLITSDMLSKDYKRSKKQSGDMNDGRDELLYDDPQPQMRNMLFAGRGDGWMTEMGQMLGLAASEWTWSVRFADFNSDGALEVYASNGMRYDTMDVDFSRQRMELSQKPNAGELLANLVKSQEPYFTDDFIFTQDTGPYKYKQADDNFGLHDQAMDCGAALNDFDGDGDLDLVLNCTNAPAQVWRNDLPQGRQLLVDLRQDGPNTRAVGARVLVHCGDKVYTDDVIVTRGYCTGEAGRLHFGLGAAETADKLVIRWPDLTTQEYADLASDQLYTITKGKRTAPWEPASAAAAVHAGGAALHARRGGYPARGVRA